MRNANPSPRHLREPFHECEWVNEIFFPQIAALLNSFIDSRDLVSLNLDLNSLRFYLYTFMSMLI